jgi:hypothetical protein
MFKLLTQYDGGTPKRRRLEGSSPSHYLLRLTDSIDLFIGYVDLRPGCSFQ